MLFAYGRYGIFPAAPRSASAHPGLGTGGPLASAHPMKSPTQLVLASGVRVSNRSALQPLSAGVGHFCKLGAPRQASVDSIRQWRSPPAGVDSDIMQAPVHMQASMMPACPTCACADCPRTRCKSCPRACWSRRAASSRLSTDIPLLLRIYTLLDWTNPLRGPLLLRSRSRHLISGDHLQLAWTTILFRISGVDSDSTLVCRHSSSDDVLPHGGAHI